MKASPIPWDAYAATRIWILVDGQWLGVVPAAKEHVPVAETWHIITAWNPDSQLLDRSANDDRNLELFALLQAAGLTVTQAFGEALDGSWPAEASFAVPCISSARAVELGGTFGQAAVFRVDPGGLHVLDCRTGEPVSSSRYVVLYEDAPPGRVIDNAEDRIPAETIVRTQGN